MAATEFTRCANEVDSGDIAAIVASDLIIQINVDLGISRYRGSSAQLIGEGLIPDGFVWPERAHRGKWESGAFEYWIQRDRPIGTKGPVHTWITGDYWVVDQSPKGVISTLSLSLKQKAREIGEIIYRQTPEWDRLFFKAYEAKKDVDYMAFREKVIGFLAPRKRGRPKKITP